MKYIQNMNKITKTSFRLFAVLGFFYFALTLIPMGYDWITDQWITPNEMQRAIDKNNSLIVDEIANSIERNKCAERGGDVYYGTGVMILYRSAGYAEQPRGCYKIGANGLRTRI